MPPNFKAKDFSRHADDVYAAIKSGAAWAVASKVPDRGQTTSSYSKTILAVTPVVEGGERVSEVRLYNNVICKVSSSGCMLYDGGWRTHSTAQALNMLLEVLNFRSRIVVKMDDLFVNRPGQPQLHFDNGMIFTFESPLFDPAILPAAAPSAAAAPHASAPPARGARPLQSAQAAAANSPAASTSSPVAAPSPAAAPPPAPLAPSAPAPAARPAPPSAPRHAPAEGVPSQSASPPPVLPLSAAPPTNDPAIFCYRDPQGQVQGPFAAQQLQAWASKGLIPVDLPVFTDGIPARPLSTILAGRVPPAPPAGAAEGRTWFFSDPAGGLHGAFTWEELAAWVQRIPIHNIPAPGVQGPAGLNGGPAAWASDGRPGQSASF